MKEPNAYPVHDLPIAETIGAEMLGDLPPERRAALLKDAERRVDAFMAEEFYARAIAELAENLAESEAAP